MNTLLPFQPDSMTPAQLAAVSYLARYSGHTHTLYSSGLPPVWLTLGVCSSQAAAAVA